MLLAPLAFAAIAQVPKDFWDKAKTLKKGELAKLCQQGGYTVVQDNRIMMVIREDGSVQTTWHGGRDKWKLSATELSQLRKDIDAFDPIALAKAVDKPNEDGTITMTPADEPLRIFTFRAGREIRVWAPHDHHYTRLNPLCNRLTEWSTK